MGGAKTQEQRRKAQLHSGELPCLPCLSEFFAQVRQLGFEEEPDYSKLREVLAPLQSAPRAPRPSWAERTWQGFGKSSSYRRGGFRCVRVSGPFNCAAICYTLADLPCVPAQIFRACRENLHSANVRVLGVAPRTPVAIVQLATRAHLRDFRVPPDPTDFLPVPRRAQNPILGLSEH